MGFAYLFFFFSRPFHVSNGFFCCVVCFNIPYLRDLRSSCFRGISFKRRETDWSYFFYSFLQKKQLCGSFFLNEGGFLSWIDVCFSLLKIHCVEASEYLCYWFVVARRFFWIKLMCCLLYINVKIKYMVDEIELTLRQCSHEKETSVASVTKL